MKTHLLVPALLLAAGCHSATPPVATAPTITSAPLPPTNRSVYRLDFVLTPKDPRDATLKPTRFTLNIAENHGGDVMIGENVPLQTPAARIDVGLKVHAHHRDLPGSSDVLLDVDLEMSKLEGSGIRKVTSHGSTLMALGKAALVTSLNDDQRSYELTVTPTKLH